MKIKLMFHDDWELWGDGSGDIHELMFDPAKRILDICDKYGAKYTFFAEFGQQLHMLKSPLKKHRKNAAAWERFLIDAVQRGHDVQLHFHPQWIGAKYKNGKWELDFTKWSIASLEKEEIYTWLKKGVDYLTGLLKPYCGDYSVCSFRAGGWRAQPSRNLITALQELQVIADVTVIKGLKIENDGFGNVDFSYAHSNILPWKADIDDVAKEDTNGSSVICMPVYSEIRFLPTILIEFLNNPLSIVYDRKRKYQKSINKERKPEYFKRKNTNKQSATNSIFGKLYNKRYFWCNFGYIHYSTIISSLNNAIRYGKKNAIKELPFILMTHSKGFNSYENFDNLLRKLSTKKSVEFNTTRNVVRDVHSRMIKQPPDVNPVM